MARTTRTFTPSFKREVVALCRAEERSARAVKNGVADWPQTIRLGLRGVC